MSGSSSESKVVLPTFDGKKDSFQVWWIRFQAYAHVKGFKAAFKKGGEKDLPASEDESLDLSKDENKKKQAEIVEIFRRLNHLETEVARLEGSVRLLQTRR